PVWLEGRTADGAGVARRVFCDDLPLSRQGEAAGLAATGGAGEIRGTRSRLRPCQGSQCRKVPRRMRAAGGRDRPAGGAGSGVGLFTRLVNFFHSGDHPPITLRPGTAGIVRAVSYMVGCSFTFWLISGGRRWS